VEGVVVSQAGDGAFWLDRPVLVTGATGFLGSHLTARLVDLGAAVVVLVRDRVPVTPVTERWQHRVTALDGDVRHQALLERILGEYEIATIFHLAAQTQVGVSNRNAVSTFESNIVGTLAVLEASRRSPVVGQVVVASSDKAYGAQVVLPYSEDMPLLPVNPYEVSKACADLMSFSYFSAFGVPASVTRCGNFFGPGDTNWERLVPGTIRSLLRGKRPVIRSDGTMTRDYLFIEDAVAAYLRMAEAMAEDVTVVGQAFNFSTETPLSVLDVVELVRASVGRPDLLPDVQGTTKNEIPHQFLSAEKARTRLGWKPLYSMREAMDRTTAWYRDFLARPA
jgi:CDP-glucose 4,6-dehydratase